jgi:hypothetical protein
VVFFFRGPYFLRACFSHATRLGFFLSFLHALSAFASFCARVSGFGFGLTDSFSPSTCTCWTRLPEPSCVAVSGTVKLGGGV